MDIEAVKKVVYDEGKRVLGTTAGGFITNLAKQKGCCRNPAAWALVWFDILSAEQAANPSEFLGGILKSGNRVPKHAKVVERKVRKATPEECKEFRAKFGHDMHCGEDEVPGWWRG